MRDLYNSKELTVSSMFSLDKLELNSSDPLGSNVYEFTYDEDKIVGWVKERQQSLEEVVQLYAQNLGDFKAALKDDLVQLTADLATSMKAENEFWH